MRLRQSLHALILADKDIPGSWFIWCPELDVATMGDNPDNAAAMLEEACRMVVEDSINDSAVLSMDSVDGHLFKGEVVRKRVIHPARLGAKSHEDESWQTFQDMLEKQQERKITNRMDIIELSELADGLDETILVGGALHIETRSGVPRVDVSFDYFGYVPCEQFTVEYRQAFERKTTISIRTSVLKKAGAGGQELVTAEAVLAARDAVGEVKVSRP